MLNRNNRACLRCNAENGHEPPSSSCKEALKKLQIVDFSLVETILYLDAYPHSRQALKHYHALLEEQKRLKESMKAAGCPPVCATDNVSHTAWTWTDGPWPWEGKV